MSLARVQHFTISLDGFGTGEDLSREAPFGHAGQRLHTWMFATRWGREMIGKPGGTTGIDDALVRQFQLGIGAEIMGAGKFGYPGWHDDPDWKGWWGPNPPFHTPVFVLTHRPRPPLEMEGGTTFHFIDAAPAEALEAARTAACGQDVRIAGGPSMLREFIRAKLVDHMVANGTLWNTDYFDATFVQQMNENKVLMVSMASWAWGVFNGTYYLTAEHQLGVAPPLKWADEEKAVDVAQGGAGWMVSRHTVNPKLATDLIVWLTTNEELWATIPNWPAYKPNQTLFQQLVSNNDIFANDPFPAMQEAAGLLGPLDKWPRFDMISPLTQVVKGANQDGVTMEDALPRVLEIFQPLAETEGYLVVTQ